MLHCYCAVDLRICAQHQGLRVPDIPVQRGKGTCSKFVFQPAIHVLACQSQKITLQLDLAFCKLTHCALISSLLFIVRHQSVLAAVEGRAGMLDCSQDDP